MSLLTWILCYLNDFGVIVLYCLNSFLDFGARMRILKILPRQVLMFFFSHFEFKPDLLRHRIPKRIIVFICRIQKRIIRYFRWLCLFCSLTLLFVSSLGHFILENICSNIRCFFQFHLLLWDDSLELSSLLQDDPIVLSLHL